MVVVTQYPQVAALAEKYSFTPLHNPYPERGQSESIRIGLAALSDCDAVMFQVADQPRLQKETVADLIGFAAPPIQTALWALVIEVGEATPVSFLPGFSRS